jgi:serine/threonine protein kinase/TPR repeat protein
MIFTERYNYDPEKDFIGTGGFSKIFRAYDNLREENVALKFFTGEVKEKYGIIAEAKRLLKLNHPNVIRFYDLETIEFTNIHMQREKILIGVLEYIDGGDLKGAISQNLSEDHKYQIVIGLLDGLSYIHSKKIVHRDLKPGNIMLLHKGGGIIPKLIDFGISKKTDEGTTSSSELLGTVEYMAPEQFNPEKYGKISSATDLWCFAVMIYELYSGERLFGSRGGGQQTEQVISKILLDKLPPNFSNLPIKIQELLTLCLVRDSKKRVQSAQELIDILEDAAPSLKPEVKVEEKQNKEVEEIKGLDSVKPVVFSTNVAAKESGVHNKDNSDGSVNQKPVSKPSNKKVDKPGGTGSIKSNPPSPAVEVSNEIESTQIIPLVGKVPQPVAVEKSRLVTPDQYVKKAPALTPPPPPPSHQKKVAAETEWSPPVMEGKEAGDKKSRKSFRYILWVLVPIVIAVLIVLIISWVKSSNTAAYLNQAKNDYLVANFLEAEDGFRLAYERGDVESAFFLGLMFLRGEITDFSGEKTNGKLKEYLANKPIYFDSKESADSVAYMGSGGKVSAESFLPAMISGDRYRDADSAQYYFDIAAEEGEPFASYSSYMYGYMKSKGINDLDLENMYLGAEVDKLYWSGIDNVFEKAKDGDQIFMNFMALAHLEGLGTEKDTTVAIDWLERSIDSTEKKGYKRSLITLGRLYSNKGNVELAEMYYEEARNSGLTYLEAASQEEQDELWDIRLEEEITDLYTKYIRYNSHCTDYEAGIAYGDVGYTELAVLYILRAALDDNALAEYSMGFLFGPKSYLIKTDLEKSVVWFEDAAASGLTDAMLSLADHYEDISNLTESFNWAEKAAEEGSMAGQRLLADKYREGDGVNQDNDLAASWYTKAMEQGSEYAEERLIELGF